MIHYGTTKTAQLAVARGLAELTAGTNVTVNSVLPGPTYSEGVADFVTQLGAARGTDAKTIESASSSSMRGLARSCSALERGGREHDRLCMQRCRVGDQRRRRSR